jgi:hypothetical protein
LSSGTDKVSCSIPYLKKKKKNLCAEALGKVLEAKEKEMKEEAAPSVPMGTKNSMNKEKQTSSCGTFKSHASGHVYCEGAAHHTSLLHL